MFYVGLVGVREERLDGFVVFHVVQDDESQVARCHEGRDGPLVEAVDVRIVEVGGACG